MIGNSGSKSCELVENKVFGVIFAPVNLTELANALKAVFLDSSVSIYESGYNGAKTIQLRSDLYDFEAYPDSTNGSGVRSDYLLNGTIECKSDTAVKKSRNLFDLVTKAGMRVQFEVYDPTEQMIFEYSSS